MFKLKSKLSIIVFCFSITLFGIIAATGIEFLFYPEEYATTASGKKAFIVIAIALPVSFGMALIIRKNVLLAEELLRLVNRDRLTDVATRDFFFARLERDAAAYGVSLMIDIDHFKSVNDTHGHLAGDKVISQVARRLSGQLRERDIVCRFGGEEFLVFLRGATPEEGWTVAERIRAAVQDDPILTDEGPIGVTVSVGGTLKDKLDQIQDAIKRADICLYQAKNLGRNRTVVDWPTGDAQSRGTSAVTPFVAKRKSDPEPLAS